MYATHEWLEGARKVDYAVPEPLVVDEAGRRKAQVVHSSSSVVADVAQLMPSGLIE